MKHLQSFESYKKINESNIYDEDFNEYLVKNMLSDDAEKSEIWSTISDVLQYMKHKAPETLSDFRTALLNSKDALKTAIKYVIQINTDGGAQYLYDKLKNLKKDVSSVKGIIIKLKVKSILQAEDLKNLLESKPWYSKVKIEGHNLLVDIKNNTVEQISNLLSHLPFNVDIV